MIVGYSSTTKNAWLGASRLLTTPDGGGQSRWRTHTGTEVDGLFGPGWACRGEDPAAAWKDMRLAACALLLELAHADGEFSVEERSHLQRAVCRQFGLEATEAAKVLDLAEKAQAEGHVADKEDYLMRKIGCLLRFEAEWA